MGACGVFPSGRAGTSGMRRLEWAARGFGLHRVCRARHAGSEAIAARAGLAYKGRATYAFQDKKWVFKALACNRNPMTPTVFPEIEPGDSSIQGQCRDIASATSP